MSQRHGEYKEVKMDILSCQPYDVANRRLLSPIGEVIGNHRLAVIGKEKRSSVIGKGLSQNKCVTSRLLIRSASKACDLNRIVNYAARSSDADGRDEAATECNSCFVTDPKYLPDHLITDHRLPCTSFRHWIVNTTLPMNAKKTASEQASAITLNNSHFGVSLPRYMEFVGRGVSTSGRFIPVQIPNSEPRIPNLASCISHSAFSRVHYDQLHKCGYYKHMWHQVTDQDKSVELIFRKDMPRILNTTGNDNQRLPSKETIYTNANKDLVTKTSMKKTTDEINMIADKVYRIIEKRIVIEKDRRGLF